MSKETKKIIAILSLAIYVAGNSVITGTLVFMQRDFGISITNAEFLVTLSSITTLITILLNETITKKIGMKYTVMTGLFLVGLSSIMPVIVKSYASVFLSRLVMGAGVGLFNGHSVNYINAFYEGDKASRLIGMRNSVEFIGQVVLLFIAGLLLKIHWTYAFLCYFLGFFLMINFYFKVPDVDLSEEAHSKFVFNKQIFFYMFFAAVMIMNMVAVSVRFPSIATLSKGIDVDVNMYMIAVPVSGMISGFAFGYVNKALKEKTIILGLIIYIVSNIILGLYGDNMYIFLLAMVSLAFSQSLCTPYLFAEIARFVRGSQARVASNLVFVGCNLGGFFAPFFLSAINSILHTDSLVKAFIAFSVIYGFLLLVNFYELAKMSKIAQ